MNPNVLPENEMEHLHMDDLHAAKLVVGLMTGVFVVGLLMYTFIMLLVM